MKNIASTNQFDKIGNNDNSSDWMLTGEAGESHPLFGFAVIEAIIGLMRKYRIQDIPELINIELQLKDVKSYTFDQQVTVLQLTASWVNDDIAHGFIEGTEDAVVFVKVSPTRFYIHVLTEEAGCAAKIVKRLLNGDEKLSAEFLQAKLDVSEVPNIFGAYPEVEY